MGQTFRRWQLRSVCRGMAVDGRAVEQGWRMKAVWLQQDCRAPNHTSGVEEQQRVPGSASELRSSFLGREGESLWFNWWKWQVRFCLVPAFDIIPFIFIYFLISDCVMFQNPRIGDCCLQIHILFVPFPPMGGKPFDTGLGCYFLSSWMLADCCNKSLRSALIMGVTFWHFCVHPWEHVSRLFCQLWTCMA